MSESAHSPHALQAPPGRQALRRRFRRLRRALGTTTQAAHAQAVARHFFAAALHLKGRTVGLYLPNDGEVDTAPLLARLLRTRRRLVLPVVRGGRVLEFYRYRADTPLIVNRFGIPEPAPGARYVPSLAVDLLLMPLVAFDDQGVRLGMGAGYYDRCLGRLPAGLRPRLVGIAHEVQRSPDPLPAASWDVPLDGVLTERGWQAFSHARPRTGGDGG